MEKVNKFKYLYRIRFTTSHPKDLSEALMRAFAELETSAGTFTLKQRIGINTGRVFAGNVGSSARVLKNLGFGNLVLAMPACDPRDDEAYRMAVDANVLIFERIREELRLGKTVRSAVEQGFGKAFLTILDCNITTLVAAFFLFSYGTGPVKGFAVTLSLGVIASLFTALVLSRLIFDYILGGRKLKTLSI